MSYERRQDDLGYADGDSWRLDVLKATMEGVDLAPPRDRDVGEPLPEQLPEGVSWAATVPAGVTWLRSADRRAELAPRTSIRKRRPR